MADDLVGLALEMQRKLGTSAFGVPQSVGIQPVFNKPEKPEGVPENIVKWLDKSEPQRAKPVEKPVVLAQ